MTIQVDFWHLVALLLAFIGTLASFGMILLKQIDSRIDHQNDRVNKIETRLNDTLASLPLEYQRREDAIRFETVLNFKLDAIGNRIERLMEKSA
jgi:predicted PurR-regulated permease PerM